jgi:hypothetical protein
MQADKGGAVCLVCACAYLTGIEGTAVGADGR